ncbi:PTS sugar transporter subunit IIC [Propionicimonas paludicola]|nr:PTS transporter subunit EIIC [Propionicimonas paludicola]
MTWLKQSLSPMVAKFTQNTYVMAVQSAFQMVLPMILVGAVANLLATFRNFLPWLPDVSAINQYSFGLLGLFLAFVIPFNVLELKGLGRARMVAGLTGISTMFALMGPKIDKNGVMSFAAGNLGAGGMTVGLIAGLLLGWLFSAYFKRGLFPKDTTLPTIVVTWFESILPVILVIAAAVVTTSLGVDVFGSMTRLFEPLQAIGNSFVGFVLLYFLMALFYSLGLSAWTAYPIFLALALPNIAANADLVAAGQKPIYITTVEVVFAGWCTFGGMGGTMPLNLQMLRSKSARIRSVGRVAIFPSIFNINEPVMYGLPVVWNPLMMIPYLIVSLIVPSLTYLTLSGGLVAIPSRPFAMNFLPQPVSTFLTNYDWLGVVFWAVLFVIAYFVYLPFFKTYEAQEAAKEKAAAEAEDAAEAVAA